MKRQGKGAHVAICDIRKSYGRVLALDSVSLDVGPAQVLALLGPSGCGKTTLLKIVAGLIDADGGEITIDGARVSDRPTHMRDMGMLFQNYALLPHLDAMSNVLFGLEMRRVPRAEARRRALAALERVKLDGMADRMPRELSGGQQQRVALARAIVYEPKILLLDEPLAALDKNLRAGMQIELRSLAKQLNLTTILVTHDQEEAMTMADSIAVMRAGRIEQVGSARGVYEQPINQFVAGFIGTMNFLEISAQQAIGRVVQGVGAAGLRLAAMLHPDADAAPAGAVLAVRPEHVTLSLAPPADPINAVAGTVQQLLFQGQKMTSVLRTEWGFELVASGPVKDVPEGLAEGVRAWAVWPTDCALLLGDG